MNLRSGAKWLDAIDRAVIPTTSGQSVTAKKNMG
jgi:hypothetical protein